MQIMSWRSSDISLTKEAKNCYAYAWCMNEIRKKQSQIIIIDLFLSQMNKNVQVNVVDD